MTASNCNLFYLPDGEGDGEGDGAVGGPEVVLQPLAEDGAHRRLLKHLLDQRQLRLHRLEGVLVKLQQGNSIDAILD